MIFISSPLATSSPLSPTKKRTLFSRLPLSEPTITFLVTFKPSLYDSTNHFRHIPSPPKCNIKERSDPVFFSFLSSFTVRPCCQYLSHFSYLSLILIRRNGPFSLQRIEDKIGVSLVDADMSHNRLFLRTVLIYIVNRRIAQMRAHHEAFASSR